MDTARPEIQHARIEAAAKAICQETAQQYENIITLAAWEPASVSAVYYRALASEALEAADEASAPLLAKLAAALRPFAGLESRGRIMTSEILNAQLALVEFDAVSAKETGT
jgi:hypothetical protein